MQNFKPAKLFDAGGDLAQRWFIFYYFRSPETGKFCRFRISISTTIITSTARRDKAHAMIKSINKKLLQGYNPYVHLDKKYKLLSAGLTYVLTLKETTCRIRSYHTYCSFVKQFNEWLVLKKMSSISVDDFNYYHAQEFMDYTKSKLKNSNRTYNHRATGMKSMFKMLLKREWVLVNPFENIERLPEEDSEIEAFTVDELMIMQQHLPAWNYDLYVCACLVFYCFIRPAEIVRLKVSNIYLVNRVIVIPGYVSKNKKQEVVHIPDALMPVLLKMNLNFPGDYFIFAKNQQRGPKEYAPTRIAEAWRKFADNHGIGKNIYSLKHTGVGLAIENGINIRDLQLQLRHSNLEMTQIYLDKFNSRPSGKLSTNFPDLSRLTKKTGPGHLPLPAHFYTPGQS
jgi:integrase